MASETLSYWKGRLVTAEARYDLVPSKSNREELLMCKRVVKRIEITLFERKKLK